MRGGVPRIYMALRGFQPARPSHPHILYARRAWVQIDYARLALEEKGISYWAKRIRKMLLPRHYALRTINRIRL